MIVLLDTSTPTCKLTLVDGDMRYQDEWEAGRGLADGLIAYLREQLVANDSSWDSISSIGVFVGPGSFTGLRIGLTVMNTIANDKNIPIVGAEGDNWTEDALERLNDGQNDRLVMPVYGREANITTPRK